MPVDTVVNIPDTIRLWFKKTYKASYRRGLQLASSSDGSGWDVDKAGAGTSAIPIHS
jgi:hypothetical protein